MGKRKEKKGKKKKKGKKEKKRERKKERKRKKKRKRKRRSAQIAPLANLNDFSPVSGKSRALSEGLWGRVFLTTLFGYLKLVLLYFGRSGL